MCKKQTPFILPPPPPRPSSPSRFLTMCRLDKTTTNNNNLLDVVCFFSLHFISYFILSFTLLLEVAVVLNVFGANNTHSATHISRKLYKTEKRPVGHFTIVFLTGFIFCCLSKDIINYIGVFLFLYFFFFFIKIIRFVSIF